ALAYQYVETGNFQKARGLVKKARDLQPDNQNFTLLETELLWATRAYAELLDLYIRESRIHPEDRSLVNEMVLVSAAMGQPEKAEPFIEQDIEAFGTGKNIGDLDEGQLRSYYKALRHLGAGETQAYIQALRDMKVPNWTFLAELYAGNLEQADSLLSDLDYKNQADVLLTMYIAASLHNNLSMADDYLQQALLVLQAGSAAEQKRAAWFERDASSPELASVHAVENWPPQKRLVFTALGYRHPVQRQMWHDQATLFNYYPGYPNPLLNQALENVSLPRNL
nr:hypothetical protein [Kiritimatiellia bacterium]